MLYVRVPKLFDEMAIAHGDGSLARRLARIGTVDLLMPDDWGLEPLKARARHEMLDILEVRHGRKCTLVTSQVPFADWHGLIGHATCADAIFDRLVHNARRIKLAGESLRRARAGRTT